MPAGPDHASVARALEADGFVAEPWHVGTYNLDLARQGRHLAASAQVVDTARLGFASKLDELGLVDE